MGIPKYYRWVSERYACLSEVVREYQIPEFDNLYLDMNGVIHMCSHPNDNDPHFRITEEKIFKDIFHYVECLFRLIRPLKVFFMAVDGVAPRAKMNQQRGRRFRTAKEAVECEKKATQRGETLPSGERFDSNCITPGTEFMVKLHEQLKYFVNMKITTDRTWQGLRIYLSGHETPGEGEHKIMDFIRAERSKPNYDPNARHCLYGLDADLIMLGLCTHEPHFSLLREEVRFAGRKSQQKRILTPEETTFHLLHLSLMREYLEHEFAPIRTRPLSFDFDIEKIIDDWVLMGFLVGNDFIPNLPNLHIVHGALPILYKTYIDVLPTLDGYINEGGKLNLARFEVYLKKLAEHEYERFNENYTDFKWLESKKLEEDGGGGEGSNRAFVGKRLRSHKEAARKKLDTANVFAVLDTIGEDEFCGDDDDVDLKRIAADEPPTPTMEKLIDIDVEDVSDMDEEGDDDDGDTFWQEFRQHKRDYYVSKLDYAQVTPDVLRDQAECFVRAVQWNLHYYYDGVCSWSWYYPHHYAPFVSDVRDFTGMSLEFELGTPFLPFEQLLAVLPSASRILLPAPFQDLMCNADSPVIDYYPLDFETDLNGKQQDWEAVVLIPFIQEERLLAAMRPLYDRLSTEERERNRHGPCLLYTYSERSLEEPYPSSLSGVFPDIKTNRAKCTLLSLDAFVVERNRIVKGLRPGVRLDVYFPGFPTLKHLPHKAYLKNLEVKVFQMASRGDNMILELEKRMDMGLLKVAQEFLGKVVYVGWPHLIEALVTSVSHDKVRCTAKRQQRSKAKVEFDQEELSETESRIWRMQCDAIKNKYLHRYGVLIGDVQILVYANPLVGRKYLCTTRGRVTLEKQWAATPVTYALHTVVKDIAVHDLSFQQYGTLEQFLPPNSIVFMLGSPHYGLMGEVVNLNSKEKGFGTVKLWPYDEPNLDLIIGKHSDVLDDYLPIHAVAQRLGIGSHLLSRITGSYYVAMGSRDRPVNQRINVGLNLKFIKKNTEMPGYTKKLNEVWTFSPKALDVMREYIEKFPDLFDFLAANVRKDTVYQDEINEYYGDGENILKQIDRYLKTLPTHHAQQQPCGGDSLDETILKAVEEVVIEAASKNEADEKANRLPAAIEVEVNARLLFKPSGACGSVAPDPAATYSMLDRVVNVRDGFTVPLGLRGTVVGIQMAGDDADVIYDVLFDKEFCGGLSLKGTSNRCYRMPPYSLINLSHGQRLEQQLQLQSHKPMAVVHPQTAPSTNALPAGQTKRKTAATAPAATAPSVGVVNVIARAAVQTKPNVVEAANAYPNKLNHSPNSPFISREIPEPQFVTPRMPTWSAYQPASCQQRGNLLEQDGDFKNIWEHLKAAKGPPLPPSSSLLLDKHGPSLSQAAKTLPKHNSRQHNSKVGSRNAAVVVATRNREVSTRRGPVFTWAKPEPTSTIAAAAATAAAGKKTDFAAILKALESSDRNKVECKANDKVTDELVDLVVDMGMGDDSGSGGIAKDEKPLPKSDVNRFGQKVTLDQLFNETRQHERRLLMESGKSRKEPSSYIEMLIEISHRVCNGLPFYYYLQNNEGVHARVQLPNNQCFVGEVTRDRSSAAESAAKAACEYLKRHQVMPSQIPITTYRPRPLIATPPWQQQQMLIPQWLLQPATKGSASGGPMRMPSPHQLYHPQVQQHQPRLGAPYFYQQQQPQPHHVGHGPQPPPLFAVPSYLVDPWEAHSQLAAAGLASIDTKLAPPSPRADNPFIPLQVTKHNKTPRKSSSEANDKRFVGKIEERSVATTATAATAKPSVHTRPVRDASRTSTSTGPNRNMTGADCRRKPRRLAIAIDFE